MLETARHHTPPEQYRQIRFVQRYAHDTGLNSASADLIFAASAIHWMEPKCTLNEVLRLLKDDGLFAFVGPSLPPVSPFLELDQHYFELARQLQAFSQTRPQPQRWSWGEIQAEIKQRQCFSLKRHFYTHQALSWNAQDYLNWLQTTHELYRLLPQKEPALLKRYKDFKTHLETLFGSQSQPCFWVYHSCVYKDKRRPQTAPS